jgi:hypothetical protein
MSRPVFRFLAAVAVASSVTQPAAARDGVPGPPSPQPDASPAAASAGPTGGGWTDAFDAYPTGSQMHGQGGWKGWTNLPAHGALTSAARASSAPNSVDILGQSDLVHELTGFAGGKWAVRARQFVPAAFVGTAYFVVLNRYDDAACVPFPPGVDCSWSVQVQFDHSANQVRSDGASGGTLPLVLGRWVEIRVLVDLDDDLQVFHYDGRRLYAGTWTLEVSGFGSLEIAAVDLWANGSTSIYYDDVAVVPMAFFDGFESGDLSRWAVGP